MVFIYISISVKIYSVWESSLYTRFVYFIFFAILVNYTMIKESYDAKIKDEDFRHWSVILQCNTVHIHTALFK